MIKNISQNIEELKLMKKYPKTLFYLGDEKLLSRRKISIVGTRRPSTYTKNMTYSLSKALVNAGFIIVSGGAMGVDCLAHQGAGASASIAVVASGLDIRYPAINKGLIKDIEEQGLVLSTFEAGQKPRPYSFVLRNELVVALGEVLIICEADMDSGSLHSANFARAMGKEIYVLSHRIDESLGTNFLLRQNYAKNIYNFDDFLSSLGIKKDSKQDFEQGVKIDKKEHQDEFLKFCKTNPSYEEALERFGAKVYEYELKGSILVKDGSITLK